MPRKVLIVDDRLESLWKCADLFRERGFEIATCRQSDKALGVFDEYRPDVVLLDIKMPGKSGFEILKEIREKDRRVCVVMLSAFGDSATVVRAMKLGADNFAEKSSDPEKILIVVEKELKQKEMEMEIALLKAEQGKGPVGVDHIIGRSEAIRRVKESVLKYADSDLAVLLTGESGVGKDLVAGAIHSESRRSGKPFQNLLCPGIAATLFEAELFGSERGAFTDSYRTRKGIIESAGAGTILLNEIVDIPTYVQAKLLLILQTGVYMRVGGEGKTLQSKARFIAATNADVRDALRTKRLREDLFFRLNEAPMEIPPLRERREDISLLAQHFIRMESRKLGRSEIELSDKSMGFLAEYDWPGNVRELETLMRAVVAGGSEDVIMGRAFMTRDRDSDEENGLGSRLKDAIRKETESIEKHRIAQALHRFGGSRKRAAEYLGISYRSLLFKMKHYSLRDELPSVQ
ncbi:MAG: sigma-54 dependent transcriptional regulator [Candidatus Eisenbacteria bacterium]